MKKWIFYLMLSTLSPILGCQAITNNNRNNTIPTSIILQSDNEPGSKPDSAKIFVTFQNQLHPQNKIGYRLFEHKPFVFGTVPEKSIPETAKANKLEKQFAKNPEVFVHTVEVNKEAWAPQVWKYYIVPVEDGFELLWVVMTKDKGLNEFYVAQQCFRMSGKTNVPWRRKIAETPAFSEYDLWSQQESAGTPRTALTFVRRAGTWQPIPPISQHVVCRTSTGLAMDILRSDGDIKKIVGMEPYGPSKFEPDIDCGLIIRTSSDDEWACGLYWECTSHVSNHHPADCFHSFVNLGPLAPNSKRAIRGRIYWMKIPKIELFDRWQKEFGIH